MPDEKKPIGCRSGGNNILGRRKRNSGGGGVVDKKAGWEIQVGVGVQKDIRHLGQHGQTWRTLW